MLRPTPAWPLSALALALAASAQAAPVPAFGGLPTSYTYVETADMTLAAPLVLGATIDRAVALKGAQADGVGPGQTRYYVEADVTALISGPPPAPARVSYLVDLPSAATGRPLKLKGIAVLLLASKGDAAGELRLIGPRAQVPRTPENEARIRALLTGALAPDAPPAITGISRAFHVPGSLPGESETQIFLRTSDNRPISLNVLRRPGEQPRWAVALSELVDASAAPPARDSLLWYRLACGLPSLLPDRALMGLSDDDAAAAQADYKVVLDGLGRCER
jgi:hypothetical protein